LPKNKSCQNSVLTIPLCRGGRDEHTGENGAEIERHTCPHTPSRASEAFAYAHRRAPLDATRLLHPDGLTWPKYQINRPMWLTRIRMTSAWHNCDVSIPGWHAMSATSQLTRHRSRTHQPRHQPQADLSRAKPRWSRGIGSSVADPMCNRIWDWI
jgi:hypothetical protein